MNIIVLIKQVPEIEKVRFDNNKGCLDRGSASAVINPFDLNALEAGVDLREKFSGSVIVVSMGPKQAESSLRDALARGADEAVLLSDDKFAGADTLATSCTLATAIRKLGSFDLVVCGEKTIDGDTGQVGPEVAEFLGIPHVSYVEEIQEVNESKITVKTKTESNSYLIELRFPALIAVTKDLNTPRLPTLKDKLKARRAPVTVWNAEDLVDGTQRVLSGHLDSPTWVVKVYAPSAQKQACQVIEGTLGETAKHLATILRNLNVFR